ncbi:hypothetical protein [Maribacter sp. R77961]|uniref:hypothetical protein n=1 Tax=Maribacter sp. R77961 TaxID=3093871 RepID=UPI0037C68CE8
MSLKKAHLYLGLGFIAIAGFLITSYTNNNLFMDRLLVASGIISCILVVKAMGNS